MYLDDGAMTNHCATKVGVAPHWRAPICDDGCTELDCVGRRGRLTMQDKEADERLALIGVAAWPASVW